MFAKFCTNFGKIEKAIFVSIPLIPVVLLAHLFFASLILSLFFQLFLTFDGPPSLLYIFGLPLLLLLFLDLCWPHLTPLSFLLFSSLFLTFADFLSLLILSFRLRCPRFFFFITASFAMLSPSKKTFYLCGGLLTYFVWSWNTTEVLNVVVCKKMLVKFPSTSFKGLFCRGDENSKGACSLLFLEEFVLLEGTRTQDFRHQVFSHDSVSCVTLLTPVINLSPASLTPVINWSLAQVTRVIKTSLLLAVTIDTSTGQKTIT